MPFIEAQSHVPLRSRPGGPYNENSCRKRARNAETIETHGRAAGSAGQEEEARRPQAASGVSRARGSARGYSRSRRFVSQGRNRPGSSESPRIRIAIEGRASHSSNGARSCGERASQAPARSNHAIPQRRPTAYQETRGNASDNSDCPCLHHWLASAFASSSRRTLVPTLPSPPNQPPC